MPPKPCCTPGREPSTDLPTPVRRPRTPEAAVRTVDPAAARAVRDLIPLAGGSFLMGTQDPDGFAADGEGPVREAVVGAFRV
ncbi:formylglycine-generating enzyme family protein, partial [Streptomyces sp. NPDC059233]